MKKNLGAVFALYPTPTTIVGTVVNGTVNWSNIAHIGIIDMDCILLSIRKSRYASQGIKENKTATVNLVSEDMIVEADYVGLVSGKNVDKSHVFEYCMGVLKNTPIIDKSPLVMECELVDIYETKDFECFIMKVVHTHVEEDKLNEKGKIDYKKVRPVLFEMPTTTYLRTGDTIAKCWNIGKAYK